MILRIDDVILGGSEKRQQLPPSGFDG